MKTNKAFNLIVTFLFIAIFCPCLFCQQESVDQARMDLQKAIKESRPLEAARLLDRLMKSGADLKTLPVTEAADLIIRKSTNAYQ
jgi:hypothetical protein